MSDILAAAAAAARRSQTYWLLAQLILEPPTAGLLSRLQAATGSRESDDAPLGQAFAVLSDAARDCSAENGMRDLAVDFTRLFGGLSESYGPPPPFESLARGEPLSAEAAVAVAAAYRDAGFRHPAPEAGPPDHAGAELRFMALLCVNEREAWHTGDTQAASVWLAREQHFLDEHVLAWLPAHCERIAAEARTPFYAATARLLSAACRADREDVTHLAALAAGYGAL